MAIVCSFSTLGMVLASFVRPDKFLDLKTVTGDSGERPMRSWAEACGPSDSDVPSKCRASNEASYDGFGRMVRCTGVG